MVSFVNTIGQRTKRTAGAILTIVMLSAVAIVGLSLLGSDVLASWKTPDSAEKTLAASQGLLTFEAPASTLAQFQAKEKDAQNGKDLVDTAALLVKDWKNTSLTLAEFQNLQRFLITFWIVQDTYLAGLIPQQNLDAIIFFQLLFLQQFALLAPPASPSS